MGERKWFQVERNKISSYICTAVLPWWEDSAPKCCKRHWFPYGVPGVSLGAAGVTKPQLRAVHGTWGSHEALGTFCARG